MNMNKLKERAKKLKTDIPAVFLALKDKRTPWYAKILAAVIVVYALSPIDLIPDFIPVLGFILMGIAFKVFIIKKAVQRHGNIMIAQEIQDSIIQISGSW